MATLPEGNAPENACTTPQGWGYFLGVGHQFAPNDPERDQ
jgi:hypothetical protein